MKLLSLVAGIALIPLATLGPPRLSVTAGSPGQPLTVNIEHHDGVEHIIMTARQSVLRDGREVTTDLTLTQTALDATTRAFALAPRRRDGESAVIVVRGQHGEDGPFAEAMVAVDGRGAVVEISYPKRKPVVGGFVSPSVSDDDVTGALRRLAAAE
jgi:hypothetical protein